MTPKDLYLRTVQSLTAEAAQTLTDWLEACPSAAAALPPLTRKR